MRKKNVPLLKKKKKHIYRLDCYLTIKDINGCNEPKYIIIEPYDVYETKSILVDLLYSY